MNAIDCARRHWSALALLIGLTPGLAGRAAANPLTITPGVGLAEEYNDNVFFQKDKVDDYITVLGLQLSVGYQTPSSTTTLNTGIAGNYFARNSVTNLNLAGAQNLSYVSTYQYSSRLSFTINDQLRRLNSSARTLLGVVNPQGTTTGDTAAQDPAQVNPGDVNFLLPHGNAFTNSFGVSASYLLTPLWTGSLNYNNGVSNFSDPGSTDLANRVGLQLAYQWSPQLSVNTGCGYSRLDASNASDSNAYTVTIGAAYEFAPLWSAFGSVGISVNSPVGSNNGSTNANSTFNVGLDRTFERSSLALGAQQGYTPSAGLAGTSLTIGGYVSYHIQLTEFLSGTLHTTYTNFDTASGNFSAYQLYAALFYPVWRRINAGLVYSYRRSDSNQAISSLQAGVVDGNIVRLQIGTTFDLWQLDV